MSFGCDKDGRESECDGPGGERDLVYTRSDGTKERLFVKSPERPFYLERDHDDGDVSRLVITFVPKAEEDLGDAAG